MTRHDYTVVWPRFDLPMEYDGGVRGGSLCAWTQWEAWRESWVSGTTPPHGRLPRPHRHADRSAR